MHGIDDFWNEITKMSAIKAKKMRLTGGMPCLLENPGWLLNLF